MGRLPGALSDGEEVGRSQKPEELARHGQGEAGLQDRLLEWRYRPDMCLIWAAFCADTALTLADGVALAKTSRCSSEVLELLSGGLAGCAEASAACSTDRDEEARRCPFASPSSVPSRAPEDEPLFQLLDRSNGPPGSAASSTPSKPSPQSPASTTCPSLLSPVSTTASLGGYSTPGAGQSPASSAPPPSPPSSWMGLGGVPALATPPLPRHSPRPAAEPCDTEAVDPCDTDLSYFRRRTEVSYSTWNAQDYTLVGRLAKSIHGEVRFLRPASGGPSVVAKVVPNEAVEQSQKKECNERQMWLGSRDSTTVEDLASEVAVLSYLQSGPEEPCPHIVKMLGVFQDAASTYLLTEYCQGGDVFDRVSSGEQIPEEEKRRHMSQLLQAVCHMHEHDVGHRDVSLENMVLRANESGGHDCVLVDFGQVVRLRAKDGTPLRYFAEAGKRMYRAPEMHVPRQRKIQVICPGDGSGGSVTQVTYDRSRCEVLLPPDASPGRPCFAEPYGYAAAPVDVFACGVCAFVLSIGKPPWQSARDCDPTFSFVRRHGVATLLKQWRGSPNAPAGEEEPLLAQMLRVDSQRRIGVADCLRNPWLASVTPPRFRA